jgi:signal transduction histidine kinase
VEVNSPLFDAFQLPIARIRYWLDGSAVGAEYKQLDNRLWLMGFIAWIGFVLLLTLVLTLSGRYLWRQSIELQKVNAELSLSARASALGSISAHLIHGIKNNLAYLIHTLRHQPQASEANAAALEMKSFIDEAVSALHMEEDFKSKINFSLQEVCEIAVDRHKSLTESNNIKIHCQGASTREISAREASLILLILSNLIHNALEVTPSGRSIHLDHNDNADDNTSFINITDSGPGIPPQLRENLFQPGSSSKPNGSGLGLAISAQIARSLNAQLTLKQTDKKGTTFQLTLPG